MRRPHHASGRLSSSAAIVLLSSLFFFSSRRRHTRSKRDWSSDVCSSDLICTCRVFDRSASVGHGALHCPSVVASTAFPSPPRVSLFPPVWWRRWGVGDRFRSEERRVGKECGSGGGGEPWEEKRCGGRGGR